MCTMRDCVSAYTFCLIKGPSPTIAIIQKIEVHSGTYVLVFIQNFMSLPQFKERAKMPDCSVSLLLGP